MRTREQIEALFDAMRSDIGVMSEYGDSEAELLEELLTCDNDILEIYNDTFLPDRQQKNQA